MLELPSGNRTRKIRWKITHEKLTMKQATCPCRGPAIGFWLRPPALMSRPPKHLRQVFRVGSAAQLAARVLDLFGYVYVCRWGTWWTGGFGVYSYQICMTMPKPLNHPLIHTELQMLPWWDQLHLELRLQTWLCQLGPLRESLRGLTMVFYDQIWSDMLISRRLSL